MQLNKDYPRKLYLDTKVLVNGHKKKPRDLNLEKHIELSKWIQDLINSGDITIPCCDSNENVFIAFSYMNGTVCGNLFDVDFSKLYYSSQGIIPSSIVIESSVDTDYSNLNWTLLPLGGSNPLLYEFYIDSEGPTIIIINYYFVDSQNNKLGNTSQIIAKIPPCP